MFLNKNLYNENMNKKGFTLIELLVVVLIIAILAAIALPKYMVTRDRAHLSGLMTIGKNVNDALDRLDISFKDNTGADCSGTSCRIKVSGKEYRIYPRLNNSGIGKNYTGFFSYTNNAFGILYVFTDEFNSTWKYQLDCDYFGSNPDVEESRCVKLANSLGSGCTSGNCDFN